MIARLIAAAVALAPLAASTTAHAQNNPAHPQWIQVLLQGENQKQLSDTLTHFGGTVTHYLPIVDGVGGLLPAAHLEPLRKAPGVARVIEDFNPPNEPEPRDCLVDGALEAAVSATTLSWTLFNFHDVPVPVEQLRVTLPSSAGPLTSVSLGNETTITQPKADPAAGIVALTESLGALPPGKSVLTLRYSAASSTISQSDFDISVDVGDCTADLVPAYPDNAGDFYYSRAVGADQLHAQGVTGKGINIAVVDSGLWEAPALARNVEGEPRIVARFNALQNQAFRPVNDDSGHGTHMASVIAHSGRAIGEPGPSYKGIAPNAGLIPVKVFDANGNGDFLDILRGIQWIVKNRERYDIRVMNMSLAAVPRFPYWDDPINQAVLKAWQAGIAVIAAAGNEGPDWGTIGSPGNNPYVITVGALTDSWTAGNDDDDYIPDFSSRGPTATGHIKPDLVAPGGHITGLVSPGATMGKDNPNWFLASGDFVSTGSSQSAALVTGIAALLLEIDPTLSNNEIKCMLTSSARPAINRDGRLSYSPFTQGAGYVDAVRAVTLGERECQDNAVMQIDAAVRGDEQLVGPAEATSDGDPTLPDGDRLFALKAPNKGDSDDRRWGVKAHVERLNIDAGEGTQAPGVPIDWGSVYDSEGRRLQQLQQPTNDETDNPTDS